MTRVSWQEKKLKDICESVIDCVNKTAPTVDHLTQFKMIRTTNVKNGYVDTNNNKHVDEATFHKWTRRQVPKKGDILLTREAPLGQVGKLRSSDKVFLGQRLMSYRVDPRQADEDFVLYSMMDSYLQQQIRGLGSGSTVQHMRVGDGENLTIRIPDLRTQRKIGSILAAYDDLILTNERRIAILKEIPAELYREWFIRFRFPGNETAPIAKLHMGEIPKGWKIIRVSDVTSEVTRGISPIYKDNGRWLVINQRCIREKEVNTSEARRHEGQVAERKRLISGDILINSTGIGTLGRVAQFIAPLNAEPITVDSHVTIVRPSPLIHPCYLGAFFKDKQREIERLGRGATGQTELDKQSIKDLKLVLPSQDVMNNFGVTARLAAIEVRRLSDINEKLASARNILIPRLIRGDLVV